MQEPLKLRITISTMNDIVLDIHEVTREQAAQIDFNRQIQMFFEAEHNLRNLEPRG